MDEKCCDISEEPCSQRFRLRFEIEKDGKSGVADFYIGEKMLSAFLANLCEETDQTTLLKTMNRTFTKKWQRFIKPNKK